MKMGLIKKSFICVLSLSFITLLVACNKNKDGVVSKTNVFAKKDVLAYAKKNKEEKDNGNVEIAVFDTNDYTVSFEDSLYALVCDNTSKYYLYLKCNNKLVDLKNDTTEYIVEINKKLTYGSNYGYYEISYSNGDYMIIDYDGEVVATKSGINNFTYQRFSNNLNNYINY